MQSGTPDLFLGFDSTSLSQQTTAVPPVGSRLAQYLQPNNAVLNRPSWNGYCFVSIHKSPISRV